MSVADLRHRMPDVPGIQNLSMDLQAGRIVLSWGEGYSAAVDATASDADIEAAVRAAIRLPPISAIPDAPASPSPAATPATGQSSMTNPADAMKAFDTAMTKHATMMEDLATQMARNFEAKLARQRDSVTKGFTSMGSRVDEQTDAFEAMMARFTNGGPV